MPCSIDDQKLEYEIQNKGIGTKEVLALTTSDIKDKEKLIEKLASNLADNADEDTLYNYFKDGQTDWLESLTDEELLQQKDFILGENYDDDL